MTVPISDRLSQLYVGNDINQRFDFTFRVFNQESESGIVVRQKTAVEFVTLDPSLYTVTLNQDNLGGHIDFISPPESNVYFYIAGATALDQLLDITNYDNFYPDAIERALDKLTALLQEWGTQLDQEKQARILADIHYDSLAMEREENLEYRLTSYINAVVGITNPAIFEGISDRMIITQDGRTQREFNQSVPFWTEDYVSFKQETYLREEQILDHTQEQDQVLQQNINNEQVRALAAEAIIQGQVNAIGVGNKAYLTYAAMDADKANIPANSKVTVTSDPDTSKRGDWQWNGTIFTQSPYDPLTQAKAYADANPLFKPVALTNANNLNDVRAEGLYKPNTGVPSLALNYPVTGLGELQVRNLGGNVCVQTYWTYGTFGHWTRNTDGSGNWLAWEQIGTKSLIDSLITTAKAPVNLTGSSNIDLNTLTTQGVSAVYSTADVNVSHFPKSGVQGFVFNYTLTTHQQQIFLVRGSNEMYIRTYWGTNGWTAWELVETSVSILSKIGKFNNLIYSQTLDSLLRNPLKATRIKLIGDSITWGMGSSAVSPTDPRTGYLTDPRNSTVFTSKTWANLLRQWIAKIYGNGSITEDRGGSAYTSKNLIAQWREIYTSVKMTSNQSVILTDSQKLAVIDTQVSFAETGTSVNLLSATFATALRPQQMEFEVTGDNLSILYQKQNVGDANDIVKIYVDNVEVDSFNYYNATSDYTAEKLINFTFGKHTIKLVNTATNANSYCRIGGFRTSKKSWVINEGIIGLSTATLLSRNILQDTITQYDDVVLFMLGTNDRAEAGGVEGFKKRLNDSLDLLISLNSNAKIVLMSSTFANTDAPTSPYKFDMGVVDKVIAAVASERNLIFISNYKACAQALIDGETILSDGLHLNDRGNQLYYQSVRNKLFTY